MNTLTRKSDAIARYLVPKAEIIRCPSCGSANVRVGIRTDRGIPIFCLSCETMTPTRREG